MNGKSETMVIRLPGPLVAEIQTVWSNKDLESFVYQAIDTYITTIRHRQLQEQLARDYDELATLYGELAAELSDETWTPLENEALLQVEQSLN